jgi:hypothetical protein
MSLSLASKARLDWIGLSRFEAIRSNDKTTQAIFISDTPSLLEFEADRRTRRDIEAHKSAHASI